MLLLYISLEQLISAARHWKEGEKKSNCILRIR